MKEVPSPTLPLLGLLDRRPVHAPPAASACPPERHLGVIETPNVVVCWARSETDVQAAQRLRYQVFVEELGARPSHESTAAPGLDIDRFDAFCEHLLVYTTASEEKPPQVIGTYRVLTPGAARRAGQYYSDTEFDLSPLRPLRHRMAELGRSCVHPDHRSGGVILTLWAALARFMQSNGLDVMIGCASIGMRDGGHVAASVWNRLQSQYLADSTWRVRPRLPLPVGDLDQTLAVDPPPLIKGYLRCGARLLGAPAWDPDFNTADLPMLLRLSDLPNRYRRHFLGTI